jgi:hypothetical protein
MQPSFLFVWESTYISRKHELQATRATPDSQLRKVAFMALQLAISCQRTNDISDDYSNISTEPRIADM